MISSGTPDGEGFAYATRHHTALTSSLGIELKRSPSDTAFRYFSLQMDVRSLCATIRDWTIAQIPGVAEGFDNSPAMVKPCAARSNPQQVAGRRSFPR